MGQLPAWLLDKVVVCEVFPRGLAAVGLADGQEVLPLHNDKDATDDNQNEDSLIISHLLGVANCANAVDVRTDSINGALLRCTALVELRDAPVTVSRMNIMGIDATV